MDETDTDDVPETVKLTRRMARDTARDSGTLTMGVSDGDRIAQVADALEVMLATIEEDGNSEKWRASVTIEREYKRNAPTHPASTHNSYGQQLVYAEVNERDDGWYHDVNHYTPLPTDTLTTKNRAEDVSGPCPSCFNEDH